MWGSYELCLPWFPLRGIHFENVKPLYGDIIVRS